MKEKWKVVDGFENYEISKSGKVRGQLDVLKPQEDTKGYKTVYLRKKGGGKRFRVHRLVANAFLANPNEYTIVNHKNRNKKDNDDNNLEWCTLTYNSLYSNPQMKPVRKDTLKFLYNHSNWINFDQIRGSYNNQDWIKSALKYLVDAGLVADNADNYKVTDQGKTIYELVKANDDRLSANLYNEMKKKN